MQTIHTFTVNQVLAGVLLFWLVIAGLIFIILRNYIFSSTHDLYPVKYYSNDKKRIKQKEKADRAAQREADRVLSECTPTIGNSLDDSFSETELGYRPMETKGR